MFRMSPLITSSQVINRVSGITKGLTGVKKLLLSLRNSVSQNGGSRSLSKVSMQDEDLESNLTTTVLKLEEIDRNLYRADKDHLWRPSGGRAVFGGQVVGQAVVAAGFTKPEEFDLHSLHCYFVRPGNPDKPILYHVERVRDGRSFSTRLVNARQSGDVILSMILSYQMPEEAPFTHQYLMPNATPPENLQTSTEFAQDALKNGLIPEQYRDSVTKSVTTATNLPMEIKPVDPMSYYRFQPSEPKALAWIKAKGRIGDDEYLHKCAVAYMSDMALLRSALFPFPTFRPRMMASLDHALWFHSDFRADEWMLYETESPRSVGARAFTIGRLWTADGTLAVSATQEGVIRGPTVTEQSKL